VSNFNPPFTQFSKSSDAREIHQCNESEGSAER